jgi:cytochrome c-type biogenesis protein CcmH
MILRFLTVVVLALLLAAPASADERMPTLSELERELFCPTCRTLLEQSHAPIAERMRAFIRTRIAAGDTKSEIKAELVADFGQGVLAAPPARGFNLLAWILPIGGFLGALAVISLVGWRWRASSRAPDGLTPMGLDTEIDRDLESHLDEELARFDS